jgi:hypothetical protein
MLRNTLQPGNLAHSAALICKNTLHAAKRCSQSTFGSKLGRNISWLSCVLLFNRVCFSSCGYLLFNEKYTKSCLKTLIASDERSQEWFILMEFVPAYLIFTFSHQHMYEKVLWVWNKMCISISDGLTRFELNPNTIRSFLEWRLYACRYRLALR